MVPGIESRWGGDFPHPSRPALGVHPASYTMNTGSFPGIKQPGRGIDRSPPSSAEVKERVELYHHSPLGPSWPVLVWTLLYRTWLVFILAHHPFLPTTTWIQSMPIQPLSTFHFNFIRLPVPKSFHQYSSVTFCDQNSECINHSPTQFYMTQTHNSSPFDHCYNTGRR